MPELPDVAVYVDRLAAYTLGQRLERLAIVKPFVLRTAEPPVTIAEGRRVVDVHRIGKRIVLALEDDLYFVLHLMIAGRLRWRATPEITMGGAGQRDGQASTPDGQSATTPTQRRRSTPRPAMPPRIAARLILATFHFPTGTLYFTEAGTTRRASLHLVLGAAALAAFDRGGWRCWTQTSAQFAARLQRENHTLKRALTDPRLFSGIGNAYSDEILHRARLSPLALTTRLPSSDVERLHAATRTVLTRVDGSPARRDRIDVPGDRHRLSRRDGRAWPVRPTVSGVWGAGSAHSVRCERNQLLCTVSDWGPPACRPGALASAQARLAPVDR